MEIQININNGKEQRVLTAFAKRFYTNPVTEEVPIITKIELKEQIMKFIKNVVKSVEIDIAKKNAEESVTEI